MFCHCDTIGFITACSKGLLKTDVHINATTGSTGAGVSPSETTHFSWRSNNMSHYKAFDHQHLGEINQSVNQLQADYTNELIFVPNRGILQEEFLQLYIRQSRKA
jgi:N-acetyl-gamma-glutamyl-phosphate reductase